MYDYFRDKYPTLFADNGFCGFECGNGWKDILDRLFAKIKDDTKVVQVKEKWGLLRVYVDTATNETYNAIDEAERESAKTCEECGSTEGVTTAGGWLKTLCQKCR